MQTEIEFTMMKNRKNRVKPIKTFDRKNKEDCIIWICLNHAAAKELNLLLRETLKDTSKGNVYEVLSGLTPLVSEDDHNGEWV